MNKLMVLFLFHFVLIDFYIVHIFCYEYLVMIHFQNYQDFQLLKKLLVDILKLKY